MSTGAGGIRWWENYLVRYLMPSIAGVVIVIWLASVAGKDFQRLLLLPQEVSELKSQHLILLFLYGNLFCYIASYPILSFHASRALDFREGRWPNLWWVLMDGYIWTFLAALFVWWFADRGLGYFLVYGVPLIFAVVQLARLLVGLYRRVSPEGFEKPVGLLYGYAHVLARRRSEKDKSPESGELMETYRHLREHGNSAYIFFLELLLAALVYALLKETHPSSLERLSGIGLLFGLWAVPAVFVHTVAQCLERRFSQYD